MIKIFDKKKVVNVKFPLTEEERQIISDLTMLMGYSTKKVDTMKIRQENPQALRITKDELKKYLDKDLQKEFFANTKIIALDEYGNPKYMKNGKVQRIGFFGALRKLEKEHKEAYKKMMNDLNAAKKAEKEAAEAEREARKAEREAEEAQKIAMAAEKEVENIDTTTNNTPNLKVVA